MKLVLPYPPSANRYWRVWRGRAVRSPEADRYRRDVGLLAKSQLRELAGRLPVFDSRLVAVTVRVYRPIRRGDLDNRLKVLLDALKGIVFTDDEQVQRIDAERFEDRKNPRVEVEFASVAEAA